MAGTADDFWKFLEALRTGGNSILSPQSVRAMTTDQTNGAGPGTAFGLGLSVITEPESAQTPQSAGTFAWGGVYGHSWFVDPAKSLTVVALTNTGVEGMSDNSRRKFETRFTLPCRALIGSGCQDPRERRGANLNADGTEHGLPPKRSGARAEMGCAA